MSRQSSRKDLRISQFKADRAVRSLFAKQSQKVAQSVLKHAGPPNKDGQRVLDAIAADRVSREIDKVLDEIYGKKRGGPSPLEEALAKHANQAGKKPIVEAVDQMKQRAGPDLARAMEVQHGR